MTDLPGSERSISWPKEVLSPDEISLIIINADQRLIPGSDIHAELTTLLQERWLDLAYDEPFRHMIMQRAWHLYHTGETRAYEIHVRKTHSPAYNTAYYLAARNNLEGCAQRISTLKDTAKGFFVMDEPAQEWVNRLFGAYEALLLEGQPEEVEQASIDAQKEIVFILRKVLTSCQNHLNGDDNPLELNYHIL